jgi:hypothetical protein
MPAQAEAYGFVLDVTAAATDVDDTLNVAVQTLVDGTNWVSGDWAGDAWRVNWIIVDPGAGAASFTFSVTAMPM